MNSPEPPDKSSPIPWTVFLCAFDQDRHPTFVWLHLSLLPLLALFWLDTTSGFSLKGLELCLTYIFSLLVHCVGHLVYCARTKRLPESLVVCPFGEWIPNHTQPNARDTMFFGLSGPAANLAVALVLAPFLTTGTDSPSGWVDRVVLFNIAFAVLNFVPSAPFDGGYVLRATLDLTATPHPEEVSQKIGLGIGGVLLAVAIVGNQLLFGLLAAVTLVTNLRALIRARSRSVLSGSKVRDAMIELNRLECFGHGTSLSSAVNRMVKSMQQVFPVLHGSELLGFVTSQSLLEALSVGGSCQYVSALAARDFVKIAADAPLSDALELTERAPGKMAAVFDQAEFLGVLFHEKLLEFLVVNGLKMEERSRDERDDFFF